MTKKAATWLILGLALAMALPAPAMASHLNTYLYNPVEHDDVGRSDEPNFGGATTLLGPAVTDRNIDTNLDGVGEAFSPGLPGPGAAKVVAPGCTDDNGRQPSGLCGLWTVGAGTFQTGTLLPPHTLGVPGMSGAKAPGRFTPYKSTSVRILDSEAYAGADVPLTPVTMIDVNHALADTPVAGALAAQGITTPVAVGPTHFFAWYGTWTDVNGNGVIDFLPTNCKQDAGCGADGGVARGNEFVWDGNCIGISGLPAPAGQRYCNKADPAVSMPMWIYPGTHHASCFSPEVGVTCSTIGMDYPGQQAVCFADAVVGTATGTYPSSVADVPFTCEGAFTGKTDIAHIDDFDQEVAGDPLLGPSNSVRRDDMMSDRTGDPAGHHRDWILGSGFPTTMYDTSLLSTTLTVTIVTTQVQPDTGTANYFALTGPGVKMTDVDKYTTWSPLADSLLNSPTGVKATSRGEWVFVRDSFIPVQKASDAITNNRLQYDQCDTSYLQTGCLTPVGVGPTLGKVDDAVFNNGIAHEPNTAADVEPGASFAAFCPASSPDAFKGWCNDYSGYAQGWHAWIDVQQLAGTYWLMGWGDPVSGNCVVCEWTGPIGEPGLPAAQNADHTSSLQPGTHVFFGIAGAWKDRAQRHNAETVIDPGALPAVRFKTLDYTVGPDHWVGDVVNTTGFLKSRGYGDETCAIGGVAALRSYAECHPYADGNRNAPPDAYLSDAAQGGEFQPAQSVTGGNTVAAQLAVTVTPNSANPGPNDCWNVPILVWRSIDHWVIGDVNAIQSYQGRCGAAAAITFPLGLSSGGTADDEIILPEGNLGQTVVSVASATVTTQPPTVNGVQPPLVVESAQDVDVYAPYAP